MPDQETIAILGTGLMGSAIVRRLSSRDSRLVVWNRTSSRAESLAAECGAGVTVAPSIIDAIKQATIIIAMFSDFAATEQAICDSDTVGHLSGKFFVNMCSGTPEEARGIAAKLDSAGASYIDAAYCGGPATVLSGSGRVFAGVSAVPPALPPPVLAVLSHLGATDVRAIGANRVLDHAVVDLFLAAVAVFGTSAPLLQAEGVPLDALVEYGAARLEMIKPALSHIARTTSAAWAVAPDMADTTESTIERRRAELQTSSMLQLSTVADFFGRRQEMLEAAGPAGAANRQLCSSFRDLFKRVAGVYGDSADCAALAMPLPE